MKTECHVAVFRGHSRLPWPAPGGSPRRQRPILRGIQQRPYSLIFSQRHDRLRLGERALRRRRGDKGRPHRSHRTPHRITGNARDRRAGQSHRAGLHQHACPPRGIHPGGRPAQSDLRQGVTLEVMGEMSMGPLSPQMQRQFEERQGDIKYKIDWQTLDQYLRRVERQGTSVNIASFVGGAPSRTVVHGQGNVPPTPAAA